ncbi:MAG TPA: T9SS type A sorting domain-containing protein [Saprospiraceae bacterium]|nr:T9SS type A sorting domain-containing protein [Saprospiraceae bacterium]HMQ83425.1 T9SS type A sorting domain-containing protein [Saprospiraceae bacterium]
MRYAYLFIVSVLVFGSNSCLFGQGWERSYPYDANGLGSYGYGREIQPTPDGGYVLLSRVDLPTGAIRNYMRVLKLDAGGQIQWERVFNEGDIRNDRPEGIHVLTNGDYLVVGSYNELYDIGADTSGIIAMRLDALGNTLWQQVYHPAGKTASAGAFTPCPDGSFLISGLAIESETSARYNYFIKVTDAGELLWEKLAALEGEAAYPPLEDIEAANAGGFIAVGRTTNGSASWAQVTRFDDNLDTLWTNNTMVSISDELWTVQEKTDGHFLIGGGVNGFAGLSPYLAELDENGNLVFDLFYAYFQAKISDIQATSDGNFVMVGSFDEYTLYYPTSSTAFITKIAPDGAIIWERLFDPLISGEMMLFGQIELSPDGGYIATGVNDFSAFVIKTDGLGFSRTNRINGQIFLDENTNCQPDLLEAGIPEWIIQVTSDDGVQYTTSDSAGYFSLLVDTGAYTVAVILPNDLWVPCVPEYSFDLAVPYDSVALSMPIQTQQLCPLMQVDIAMPFLRRCFDNTYTITYCNTGTQTAENAYVDVQLDDYLSIQSATLPYEPIGGQSYRFSVGDVAPLACGSFQIVAYLDCDNTVLGQTHCTEAHVFPDTLCIGSSQSLAQIDLHARCAGDSAVFTLKNIGSSNMQGNSNFIVIEDDVMYLLAPFQLNAGDSLQQVYPTDGATFRMEAKRLPDLINSPYVSVTLEGCVESQGEPFSTGFFNQFPIYPPNEFTDIDCHASIGAYDPNDKQAFPMGYGADHFIKPHTSLEYLIRFQNTGTDTAFNVVIRDTLSALLNPASVQPGAASHPYRWTLSEANVLHFYFDNIMLPDSNANEAASHGFVSFRIDQQPEVDLGSRIFNNAAIYFDFNKPVITNTTWHEVAENFIAVSNEGNPPFQLKKISLAAYPNPSNKVIWLAVQDLEVWQGRMRLYDANSRLLEERLVSDNTFAIDVEALPSGIYWLQVVVNEGLIGRVKLVVE